MPSVDPSVLRAAPPAVSSAPLDRRAWRAWAATLTATGLVLALVASPPWLPDGFRTVVQGGFSAVCHQMPSRSFHAHGVAFAVCHRCTGIYAGLVLGVLVWPLVRAWVERVVAPRVPLALGLAALPLAVDWALGFFGLWPNTPLSQTATGALFGVVAGLLLARGMAGAGQAVRASRSVS